MNKKTRASIASLAIVGGILAGLAAATPAAALGAPLPNSCAKSTFGEVHDGYLWWYKYVSQRFSGGTYYYTYDVGITTYPSPVTHFGYVEKACGHSNFSLPTGLD